MPKLKVIANKLNKRTGPVTDFSNKENIVGTLNAGAVFNSVAEVTNNLGTWHVDENGFVVWAGGLGPTATSLLAETLVETRIDAQKYIDERFDGNNLSEPIDYNLVLNIDEDIKVTNGRGVVIGVLDSPISKQIQFKNQVGRPFNIDHPADAHGTFISGLLAGSSGICGIAQDVELIELPLRDEFGNQPDSLVTNVFNFLKGTDDFMILNISQRLPTKFSSLFDGLKNKVIVAAAGMNQDLQSPGLIFPSSLPNVIAVGCLSKSVLGQIPISTLNNKLDFIIPDFSYASFGRSADVRRDSGDSYSCAIISAIIALLMSSGKITQQMNLVEIKQQIEMVSKPILDASNFDFLGPLKLKT
jgi:hypothetical protein